MEKIYKIRSILLFSTQLLREKGVKYLLRRLTEIWKLGGLKAILGQLVVRGRDNQLLSNRSKDEYFNEIQEALNRSIHFTPFEDRGDFFPSFQTKLIAFYLPQFHPFDENDKFWGRGFTEWTNVTKSFPLYHGHNQPRLPLDLGFYDLRLKSNLEKQASIAKNYGIHGFCIHYYWFSGHKVMDTPINLLFENKNIDINFCICWANENWTRRWDGNDKDVLLAQLDKEDDYLNFITDVSKYFSDNRYIKISGCPVLVVYRAELLKDPANASDIWNQYVKTLGFPGLHLILSHSFKTLNPNEVKFNASVDFAPNTFPMKEISLEKKIYHPSFQGRVYDYQDAITYSLNKSFNYPSYKSLCLEWDNTARKNNRATILDGCTPVLFAKWLKEIIQQGPLNDIVFLNAWNEWAEGTYLEPDRRNGYAYLQKCYEVLNNADQIEPVNILNDGSRKICVYTHIHYFDVYQVLSQTLKQRTDSDYIFTVTDNINSIQIKKISSDFPGSLIVRTPNKGRDIFPFFSMLEKGFFDQFEFVCKLHTKKSPHREDGIEWGKKLTKELIEFTPNEQDSNIAIWAPKLSIQPIIQHLGSNKSILNKYSKVWRDAHFVAGTMFWFRPAILKKEILPKVLVKNFEPEPISFDGTYAHALERLIGAWILESGCKIDSFESGVHDSILTGAIKNKVF